MSLRKIYYKLHSGKNPKLLYYLRAYSRRLMPGGLLRSLRPRLLAEINSRPDRDEILSRADYYCKITPDTDFDREAFRQKSIEIGRQPMTRQKVYYIDSMEYGRYFSPGERWILEEADVNYALPLPSVTKSRPVRGGNANNVLLNLDKVRHFLFVKDKLAFRDKKPMVLFRGKVAQSDSAFRDAKESRVAFLRKWYGTPMVDAGAVDRAFPEWHTHKLTIDEQLRYKFIMAIEGNDVASNLKWIMSSNSVAVMPRPTCETWFMEGTLIPNYHYIEIKSDFSDLEERLTYYLEHPEEAEQIIAHAHDYVARFRDKHREKLISLLVLSRYFDATR